MKQTERIRTKRLILRALTDEELAAKAAAEPDAHMKAAYGQMLDGCMQHPAQRLWYACWLICLKDGTPIGDLCLKGAPDNGDTEIGYGIDGAYRNQGYATEAVNGMADWAFAADSSLFYLMAEAEPDNLASRRVPEKAGFTPIGNGSEGLLYHRKRPRTAWLSIYMCLFMGVGVCFGTIFDNLAIGLSLGTSIGVALGAMMDASEKKRFQAAEAAHARKYGLPLPDDTESDAE